MQEKHLSLSGDIDPKTAIQFGKLLGVEYLVTGAVTELGATDRNAHVPGGLLRGLPSVNVRSQKMEAALDARAFSTSTGEIVWADTARDELSDSSVYVAGAGGGASDASGVVGKIAKADGGTLYVNAGSEAGVKEGDEFQVYRVGEQIKDPDTGEVLGANEVKVGRVRITSVKGPRLSIAASISGSGFRAGDTLRK